MWFFSQTFLHIELETELRFLHHSHQKCVRIHCSSEELGLLLWLCPWVLVWSRMSKQAKYTKKRFWEEELKHCFLKKTKLYAPWFLVIFPILYFFSRFLILFWTFFPLWGWGTLKYAEIPGLKESKQYNKYILL